MKKIIFISMLLLLPLIATSAKKHDQRRQVLIETSLGNIRVVLYDETPLHRDNFIKLVNNGFYNGLLFHRTIKNFMIQGGAPDSKDAPKGKLLGNGELGYTIPAEFNVPLYYHKRGALAMAREGDDTNPERRSSASQFYIVWGKTYSSRALNNIQAGLDAKTDGQVKITADMADEYETVGGTPFLDGMYTVFGEVIEGLDIVKKIQDVATDKNDRPLEDVKIIRATVVK